MLQLLFWILFIVVYAGFALWLAKSLLNAIFLAVSSREASGRAVRIATRQFNRRP